MLEFTNILKPHKKHVLKTLMIIKSMVCLPYTLTIIQEPTHWTFNVFMNIHYSIGLPMIDRNSLTLAIKWLKRYLLNKRPRGLINYLSSNSHTPPPPTPEKEIFLNLECIWIISKKLLTTILCLWNSFEHISAILLNFSEHCWKI